MNQPVDESQQFVSLLVDDGLIERHHWQTALSIQQSQGGRLIEILMGLCPISEEELYQSIARQLGLPFWYEHELITLPIDLQLLHQFPLFLMMEQSFLPIKLDPHDHALHLVLPNPLDQKTLDAIKLYAQADQLAIGISTPSAVINAIQLHYQSERSPSQDTLPPAAPPTATPSGFPSAQLFDASPSSYDIPPPKLEVQSCPACGHLESAYNERCTRCGSPMNLRNADPLIGKTVGHFRLEKKLGEGGMGLVYMATNLDNGKDAAIKILRTHLSTNERVVRRFHREAQAQNQLRHPGIVFVHDFGFEEGVGFFIAMEFLKGISLEEVFEDHPDLLTMNFIRSVIHQVCDAIGFAHSRGIFHRDLKPDNIFIVEHLRRTKPDECIKILDFGVAKMVASEEDQRLTRTGMTIGTPRYMAPEQAGEGESDHRADIYSMGVIIYEILTGKPPFEGSSAYQIMLRHVYADPPTLSLARSDLPYPPELEDLVQRTLAKDPKDRPASMDMLWHELAHALDRFAHYLSPDLPLLNSTHAEPRLEDFEEHPETTDQPVIVGRMMFREKQKQQEQNNLPEGLSPSRRTPSSDRYLAHDFADEDIPPVAPLSLQETSLRSPTPPNAISPIALESAISIDSSEKRRTSPEKRRTPPESRRTSSAPRLRTLPKRGSDTNRTVRPPETQTGGSQAFTRTQTGGNKALPRMQTGANKTFTRTQTGANRAFTQTGSNRAHNPDDKHGPRIQSTDRVTTNDRSQRRHISTRAFKHPPLTEKKSSSSYLLILGGLVALLALLALVFFMMRTPSFPIEEDTQHITPLRHDTPKEKTHTLPY